MKICVQKMASFGVPLFTLQLVLLSFANAAVINPPSNLLLSNTGVPNAALPNASFTYNQTISRPFHNLPASPYIYPIPDHPSTVITFSDYTDPISELSVVECLLSANQDVTEALEAALRAGDRQPLLPQPYIRFEAEHAALTMTTTIGPLKWLTWGQMLKALRMFLSRWEYVGLRFVIEEHGLRVATGALAGR